jgi:predicted MFS family arabinose efflux permease
LWSQAFVPFVPAIADDLGTTVALVGQVSTASLIALGIGSLASGPFADRYGHRRSILVGLGIGIVAALLFAGARSYLVLLAAAGVGGLGVAMIHGVVFGLVAAGTRAEGRRRALGLTQAAGTSSGILGAPLLTAIASAIGWRGTFVVIAILLLLALLLGMRWLPRATRPPVRTRAPAFRDAYRPLIHDAPTRALYLAAIVRAMGFAGPAIYLGAFFITEHGLSLGEVGLALMVAGIGLFAGNLAAGAGWLGRFELRAIYALSTACLGFGWLLVYSASAGATAAVVIVTLTFFVSGISFTSHTTLLAGTSPGGPATTMTLNTAVIGLGIAAGTASSGLLLGLGGYPALGLAAPLFTLAAALVVWHAGRAGRSPRPG